MNELLRDEVRRWLGKALHDLGSARKLSQEPESFLDTAIYHCQQAAEKAVKAFLTFQQIRFGRTHDLEVLTSLAATIEPRFEDWAAASQMLTPYATIYRYPTEMGEPDRSEFDEALQLSAALVEFVLSVLPGEVHPATE